MRPIHHRIAAHLVFKRKPEEYFHYFGLAKMSIVERWSTHSAILREVAALPRDFVLSTAPTSKLAKQVALGSLVRTILRNDCTLANAVIFNFVPAL